MRTSAGWPGAGHRVPPLSPPPTTDASGRGALLVHHVRGGVFQPPNRFVPRGWLGGRLFDAAGDYRAVWWAAIGLGLFAMLIYLPIDDGGSPRRPQVLADRRPAWPAAS